MPAGHIGVMRLLPTLCAGMLCLFAAGPTATAQERHSEKSREESLLQRSFADVKRHGEFLHQFEQYQLELQEQDGWITVLLIKKERIDGGPVEYGIPERWQDKALGGVTENELIRHLRPIELARMRSDVIIPSAPNYVRNPGYRYRILVEGLSVAPDYHNAFDVDASNARAAVMNEAFKLYSMAPLFSVEQEAVYFGVLLGMSALNESNRLPAQIPLTVLRSKVGQFRIQNMTLGRRKVAPAPRFSKIIEGQRWFYSMLPEDETLTDPTAFLGPAYRRGFVESPGSVASPLALRYNQRENLQIPDSREDQLKSLSEHQIERQRARDGTSLTAPNDRFRNFDPLGRAQAETLELLTGMTIMSAEQARVRQLDSTRR